MAVKFNPFTGQLQIDEKGSGGGSSYIDGEVAAYGDLSLDAGVAPLNSAWLVREASGTWLLGRKPAGIYIRTATAGSSRDADYTYAGILPDVFSDANFTLYDESDSTKNAKFQLSGIATGTTRTISVPNKNVTLDDASDARTPSSHASTHHTGGTDAIAPNNISASWAEVVSSQTLFANTTLSAGRNRRITITTFGSVTITLPTTSENGDILTLVAGNLAGGTLTIQTSLPIGLATMTTAGQSYTFISSGSGAWTLRNVNTHTHAAADVTSGVFDNARINFAAPSAIGSTTPSTGAFTTLSANNGTLTASAPVLDLSQTWNNAAVAFTGVRFDYTATANSTSSSYFTISRAGSVQFAIVAANANTPQIVIGSGGFQTIIRGRTAAGVGVNFEGTVGIATTLQFGVGSTTGSGDINITREAAATLALRDAGSTFRLYNTFTDSSNYERGFMRWNANRLDFGTDAAGTGTARNVAIVAGANTYVFFNNGEGGSPLSWFVPASGTFRFDSRARITSPADSVLLIRNNAGDDFNRLQFGGTTSSFPALKRSSTALQVRLADDSAFAPLAAAAVAASDDVEITDSTKGVILRSPNNTRYRLTVSNSGLPIFTALLLMLLISLAPAQVIGIGTDTNGIVRTDRTNTLTFTNAITASNQTAASALSVMTRDLTDDNPLWSLHSVRWMGAYSFGSTGTGSAGVENYVRGGGQANSGTSSNGYGRMSVYRGINDNAGLTGGGIRFGQDIFVAALLGMTSPTTNSVYRVVVGGNGGVPPPADSNALSARGFGVEFGLGTSGDTLRARLFAHNGTTYTNSAWTADIAGSVDRQQHIIVSAQTNGTVSLFLSTSSSSYISPARPSTTPTLTLSGGPTNSSGGAFVDIVAVNNSSNAPATSANIIFYNGFLEVR